MSDVWTKRSGTKLAVLQENESASIDLPLSGTYDVSLISGSLPAGMVIDGSRIIGVPQEVPRNTTFRFVLRASTELAIYDRTYSIEIQGADEPEWITSENLLPVGKNEKFYILDSSPVDFQLEAVDSDTTAGQELQYFIASGDGELPPGITLTEDGRLVGVVEPILALEKEAGSGNFDTGRFDRYPYDFAIRQIGDFDSFAYDVTDYNLPELEGVPEDELEQAFALEYDLGYDSRPYDLTTPVKTPKKLNRNYEFTVSVSDGDTVAQRTFKIFVVGDDFLRSDNVLLQVGTGIFTADNTYLRTPIWLTPTNLGVRRANNFITLFLETLDPNTITGVLAYELLPTNDDGSPSILPPGTELDRNTGEVFGRVPYQPAITRDYKFSVKAIRFEAGTELVALQPFAFEDTGLGSVTLKISKLDNLASRAEGRTFTIEQQSYRVESVDSFDQEFDILTLDRPLEQIIKQGQEINLGRTTVASIESAQSSKTFQVSLIGEIDSTIKWLTDANLGSIPSNYISILSIKAETNVPNSFLLYTLEEGELPPGLELSFNGEIIGRVDNASITESQTYSFTAKARDQFGFSAIERTFSLAVINQDDKLYSNVYYKTLLPEQQRREFIELVSDSEIFLPEIIYRPQDPNFGIQKEIKMLLYAGIETEKVRQYVAAAAKFAARKTLQILDIKKAVAKEPGTDNEIYEVVYLDVYDPNEKSGNVAPKLKTNTNEKITVDSIRTTPDNPLYDTNRLSSIFIDSRTLVNNKIYFEDSIPIITRSGSVKYPATDKVSVETRTGNTEVEQEVGSSTNIFYRPINENTTRADSDAVRVSDAKNQTRYISNTSNIRESLRTIGETERDFLPLWMRTAQPGTLQQLGYTLAVPLAYCLPGEADRILSAIRVKGVDFRQFHLEVDRFVIDATEDNSQEQYIVFANYEFNLA